MKKTLAHVAVLKMIDLGYQIAAFITMIVCVIHLGPLALYIMGAAQFISAIFWRFHRDIPAPRYRRRISNVFVIVGLITILSTVSIPLAEDELDGAFGIVSIFLLYVGPFLGIWYFVVTIREIFWYRQAALPAYQ